MKNTQSGGRRSIHMYIKTLHLVQKCDSLLLDNMPQLVSIPEQTHVLSLAYYPFYFNFFSQQIVFHSCLSIHRSRLILMSAFSNEAIFFAVYRPTKPKAGAFPRYGSTRLDDIGDDIVQIHLLNIKGVHADIIRKLPQIWHTLKQILSTLPPQCTGQTHQRRRSIHNLLQLGLKIRRLIIKNKHMWMPSPRCPRLTIQFTRLLRTLHPHLVILQRVELLSTLRCRYQMEHGIISQIPHITDTLHTPGTK
mmetsp:Transcript_51893/g.62383  ORF Transcript_51893/g.62383 Transcript_51893/m.62383 type:complete len:249 (-) Transcript_51893:361-1107(-)